MKTLPLIPILSLLPAACAVAQEKPLLSYRVSGAGYDNQEVGVEISQTGGTVVFWQKHGAQANTYRTSLSPEELESFRVAIRATGFFTLADPPQGNVPIRIHSGETTLTIDMGGQNRTLLYSYRPEMAPLEQMVRKLNFQAFAAQALESDGDIYTMIGAVSPLHSGGKALQPQALKAPFMDYIRGHRDRQRVAWALEGLSHVTTPEEFCGFVSAGLDDPDRREALLSAGAIGSTNFPKAHRQAMYPLAYALVREDLARKPEPGTAESNRIEGSIEMLADGRYQPVLPLLVERLEKHDLHYTPASLYPLARLGEPALAAILPYLDDSNANRRLSAVELIQCIARNGPNGGFSNPLPKDEFDGMIPAINGTVIPRMRKMTENDPSENVRKKAGEAVEEILRQLKKEESTPTR